MTKYTKAQRRMLRIIRDNPNYHPMEGTTHNTLEILIGKQAVERLTSGRLKLLVDPDQLPPPFSSDAANANEPSDSPSKPSKTPSRSRKK